MHLLTNRDNGWPRLVVENIFTTSSAKTFLVLRRLVPYRKRHPQFVGEVTQNCIPRRTRDDTQECYTTLIVHELSPTTLRFVAFRPEGSHRLPLLGMRELKDLVGGRDLVFQKPPPTGTFQGDKTFKLVSAHAATAHLSR